MIIIIIDSLGVLKQIVDSIGVIVRCGKVHSVLKVSDRLASWRSLGRFIDHCGEERGSYQSTEPRRSFSAEVDHSPAAETTARHRKCL